MAISALHWLNGWLTSCILLFTVACGQADQSAKAPASSAAQTATPALDSVRQVHLRSALAAALRVAVVHQADMAFAYDSTQSAPDGQLLVITSLKLGPLFAHDQRHLLVRRLTPDDAYFNVFHLRAGRFVAVLADTIEHLAYLGDSIYDVNGDQRRDLLLNFYPASGCCLRNAYSVFLYRKDTGSFSRSFRFINPTFSPAEHVVRGIAYSHLGEGPLYKYRWRGLRVDTVEYIYPADSTHRAYLRQPRRRCYCPHEPIAEQLPSLPSEYRRLDGIEWFLGR